MRLVRIVVVALVAVFAAACAGSAPSAPTSGAAADSVKKNPSSINLQVVFVDGGDVDGDGIISHGDVITYTFDDSANWNQLSTSCRQGGVLVAAAVQSPPQASMAPIELRSRLWVGGAAECIGELQQFWHMSDSGPVYKTLASVSFSVAE
jgi:hypothetical protein